MFSEQGEGRKGWKRCRGREGEKELCERGRKVATKMERKGQRKRGNNRQKVGEIYIVGR